MPGQKKVFRIIRLAQRKTNFIASSKMAYIQKSVVISATIESVFNKHATLSNLQHILAGILDVEYIDSPIDALFFKQEFQLYLGFKGISRRCELRVEELNTNKLIEIRQVKGLFKSFHHKVKFEDHGGGETLVTDLADYKLPLGIIGHLVDDLFLKEEIEKIIVRRHERLKEIFSKLES